MLEKYISKIEVVKNQKSPDNLFKAIEICSENGCYGVDIYPIDCDLILNQVFIPKTYVSIDNLVHGNLTTDLRKCVIDGVLDSEIGSYLHGFNFSMRIENLIMDSNYFDDVDYLKSVNPKYKSRVMINLGIVNQSLLNKVVSKIESSENVDEVIFYAPTTKNLPNFIKYVNRFKIEKPKSIYVKGSFEPAQFDLINFYKVERVLLSIDYFS